MKKEQAAKYQGVSDRTFQKHTAAGRISAKYPHGERRQKVERTHADLEAFAQKLCHESQGG